MGSGFRPAGFSKPDWVFENPIRFLKTGSGFENPINFLKTESVFEKPIHFSKTDLVFKNWNNFFKTEWLFENPFHFLKTDSVFKNWIHFFKTRSVFEKAIHFLKTHLSYIFVCNCFFWYTRLDADSVPIQISYIGTAMNGFMFNLIGWPQIRIKNWILWKPKNPKILQKHDFWKTVKTVKNVILSLFWVKNPKIPKMGSPPGFSAKKTGFSPENREKGCFAEG